MKRYGVILVVLVSMLILVNCTLNKTQQTTTVATSTPSIIPTEDISLDFMMDLPRYGKQEKVIESFPTFISISSDEEVVTLINYIYNNSYSEKVENYINSYDEYSQLYPLCDDDTLWLFFINRAGYKISWDLTKPLYMEIMERPVLLDKAKECFLTGDCSYDIYTEIIKMMNDERFDVIFDPNFNVEVFLKNYLTSIDSMYEEDYENIFFEWSYMAIENGDSDEIEQWITNYEQYPEIFETYFYNENKNTRGIFIGLLLQDVDPFIPDFSTIIKDDEIPETIVLDASDEPIIISSIEGKVLKSYMNNMPIGNIPFPTRFEKIRYFVYIDTSEKHLAEYKDNNGLKWSYSKEFFDFYIFDNEKKELIAHKYFSGTKPNMPSSLIISTDPEVMNNFEWPDTGTAPLNERMEYIFSTFGIVCDMNIITPDD